MFCKTGGFTKYLRIFNKLSMDIKWRTWHN